MRIERTDKDSALWERRLKLSRGVYFRVTSLSRFLCGHLIYSLS